MTLILLGKSVSTCKVSIQCLLFDVACFVGTEIKDFNDEPSVNLRDYPAKASGGG